VPMVAPCREVVQDRLTAAVAGQVLGPWVLMLVCPAAARWQAAGVLLGKEHMLLLVPVTAQQLLMQQWLQAGASGQGPALRCRPFPRAISLQGGTSSDPTREAWAATPLQHKPHSTHRHMRTWRPPLLPPPPLLLPLLLSSRHSIRLLLWRHTRLAVGFGHTALAWLGCTHRGSKIWLRFLVVALTAFWGLRAPWVGCQLVRGTLMLLQGLGV
jgi:hypothetical protein